MTLTYNSYLTSQATLNVNLTGFSRSNKIILVSFESSRSGEKDAGNKYSIVFFNEIENFWYFDAISMNLIICDSHEFDFSDQVTWFSVVCYKFYFTCSKNNHSWKRFWDTLPPIQNPSFFLVRVLFVNIESSLISYSWTVHYKMYWSLFAKAD